ncbi:hypothetical protein COOONC_27536 [Cooperia oncophora]
MVDGVVDGVTVDEEAQRWVRVSVMADGVVGGVLSLKNHTGGNNVFILFFFQIYNGWSGSFNVDPVYSILYPIIFTSLQPIIVGVVDQDVPAGELLSNPLLYSQGRRGTKYTYQLFAINTLDGIWQAAVVFFTSYLVSFSSHTKLSTNFFLPNVYTTFTDQECELWQFGFFIASSMMFTNTVHLGVEVRYWVSVCCC